MLADVSYRAVVDAILRSLDGGVGEWKKPWATGARGEFVAGGRPLRAFCAPYRGYNGDLLWRAAVRNGHTLPTWMTGGEARAYNGVVRHGERGELIRCALSPDGAYLDEGVVRAGSSGSSLHLKDYEVFNVGQIDGLPSHFYRRSWEIRPFNGDERIHHAESFFRDLGVDIRHKVDAGGAEVRAFCSRDAARICMPPWELFNSGVDYYETLAHESLHWAINCNWPHRPQGAVSAMRDELIAEVGAVFLCVDLGISPGQRDTQVAYINEWLAPLGGNLSSVVIAAGYAERAVRWLHQDAPGYRLVPGIAHRGVVLNSDGDQGRGVPDVNQRLTAARDARRFVGAAEAVWVAGRAPA